MAEGGEDQEQKTEEPTQKRLDEAHQKGNVPTSKEIGNFFMLGVLALSIAWFVPSILRNGRDLLIPFIASPHDMPVDPAGLGGILIKLIFGSAAVIVAPLIASFIAAIAAGLIQNGIIFSSEPITPKFSKISPMAGLGRLFSSKSVVEFIKSLLKLIVVGSVAFFSVYPDMPHIRQLPNSSVESMLLFMSKLAIRLSIGVVVALFFIALFDFIYQRFQFMKNMRMSKQEIRDEYKQSEGDPHIKARLRRLRQERARTRMMANVPGADVVITNPTHYAVALKYDTKNMKAPTLVAKGQDLIALRIRELAEENKVPIVENPPLARALFASVEVDQEIPVDHYEAVAKIISYVYNLKGKRFS